MEELKQRRLFDVNEFKLKDKGLQVKYKRLGEYIELTIPYEKITNDITFVKQSNKSWFIASML